MVALALVIAASVGIPCAILFAYLLRHWIFAALALCPPLAILLNAAIVPQASLGQAVVAAIGGTMVALSLADEIVRGVSAGQAPARIASRSSRVVARTVVPVLTAYLLVLGVLGAPHPDWIIEASIAQQFASSFAGAFLGAWGCAYFPFSEQSIANANAAREWRERMLETYFPEIPSRWALSVTGIAIVLGTVALFGIRDAHVYWSTDIVLGFSAGAVFMIIGFVVIARDWRMALALTLANLFVGVLLMWAYVRASPYVDRVTLPPMMVLSALPLSMIAVRARLHVKDGAGLAAALSTAVRDVGIVAVFLGVAFGVPGIGGVIIRQTLVPGLVFAVASVFAALLLFPALTVAIHTILPRYRTVDEVFGKR